MLNSHIIMIYNSKARKHNFIKSKTGRNTGSLQMILVSYLISLMRNLHIKSPFAALCVVSIFALRSFSNNSVSTEHASQCFSAICMIGQLYSNNTCLLLLEVNLLDSAIYP